MDALLMDLKDQDSVGCGECLRCAPGCDCIYDVCDRYGLDEGAVCFHEPACDVCKQACADGPPGSDCRDSCDGSAACGTEAPTVVSKCTRFGGAVDGTDTDGVSPPEPYAAPLVRRPLPPHLTATSDTLRVDCGRSALAHRPPTRRIPSGPRRIRSSARSPTTSASRAA